jgi:translation initiation factor IF-1
MVSVSKIIATMSCGFLLCLGLSNVASSADKLDNGKSVSLDKDSGSIGDSKSGKTIKGEVLRVEGENNYFVREEDGKVLRMHVDKTTRKPSVRITPGDYVLAKVDNQNHAISILSDQPESH